MQKSLRNQWLEKFCRKGKAHSNKLWGYALRGLREQLCPHRNRKRSMCIDCRASLSPAVKCVLEDRDSLKYNQIDDMDCYLDSI
jgi:hypothetical protein